MKKKLLIALIIVISTIAFFEGLNSEAYTEPSGAPVGVSGSPKDGGSCTNCHSGTATKQVGLITSNVGPNGYVPGNTYTITGTITSTGKKKFGFQISPQSQTGTLQGTMVVTNSTATQLVGSGKYITHKSAGTTGTDTKTWTFDWKAPAKGTGSVTFYGALMASNNNASPSGDLVYTSSLVIPESISTGIETNGPSLEAIRIYPVPANNALMVEYTVSLKEKVEIRLTDLQGKIVEHLLSEVKDPGTYKESFSINPAHASGTYLIQIKTNHHVISKKLMLQH